MAKTQFLDHEIFGLNKNENFERKIFDGEKYVFKDIWILAPKILLSKYFQNDLIRHTIRKVKFLSKNSILTKPQHFHEFFTQIFFDNFSREIEVVNS